MNVCPTAILAFALLAAGCDNTPNEPESAAGQVAVSFAEIKSKILDPKCVSCHNSPDGDDGINLDSHAAILSSVQTHGHPIVEPGNPGASHLLESMESGAMPPGGPRLSEAEIDAVSTWIVQGALDN